MPEDLLRGRMPDLYFVNASSAQMSHHSELLRRLPTEMRVIEFLHQPGALLTDLSLCAYDDAKPGLLAKLCGALAALGVTVHTASIFTLPGENGGPGIVLDTLQVSQSRGGQDVKLEPPQEEEIRATLEHVLQGELHVPTLLVKARRPWHARLTVQSVSIKPDEETGQQVVTVQTSRQQLAVFRMAASIAELGFDIQSAQIHVASRTTKGIFFVDGHLSGIARLETRLRQSLQRSGVLSVFSSPTG